MAMKLSSSAPVQELLSDDNYEYWRSCMTNYLVGQDLWDVVERTIDKDADLKTWNTKNAMALHAIQISCPPGKFLRLEKTDSAPDAWDELVREPAKGENQSTQIPDIESGEGREELGFQPQEAGKDGYDLPVYKDWYQAFAKNDQARMIEYIEKNRESITAKISNGKGTILIDSVLARRVEIVQKMVESISIEDLEDEEDDGFTALSAATFVGDLEIAKILINRNKKLVSLRIKKGYLPVVIAAANGHKELTRYLYEATPLEEITDSFNVLYLINYCIISGMLDISLHLLKRFSKWATTAASDKISPLYVLAGSVCIFERRNKLGYFEKLIYSCIPVPQFHASKFKRGDIETSGKASVNERSTIKEVLNQLIQSMWRILKYYPTIHYVYDVKMDYEFGSELLRYICEEISKVDFKEYENIMVKKAMFRAIKNGILEVVSEVMKCHPYVIWYSDDLNRTILSYAILERQDRIFTHLKKSNYWNHVLASLKDKSNNNVLHQVARLPSTSRLAQVTGAALQMQRELQWFEEVQNIAQPFYIDELNSDGKNPKDLFTEEHTNLVRQGEEWVKNVATSSTVVAALIATIMFAAAFTVPGGYNNKGEPEYLSRRSFILFMISDAISLFFSCSSVLVFLGLLTLRYKEEDFHRSIPRKLIVGLVTLFFSIVTMMLTFGSAIVLMLQERWSWITFPIILLASMPGIIYVFIELPLLYEVCASTRENIFVS